MSNGDTRITDDAYAKRAIMTALRIGFLAMLLLWSYRIIQPFVSPVVWGIIISVAVYPIHLKLTAMLKNKEKLSATLLTLVALAIVLVPAILFTETTVESLRDLSAQIEDGTLQVPQPSEGVADWPVVGKPIYEIWDLASKNLEAAIEKLSPVLKDIGPRLLAAAAGVGGMVLQFIISIIIAGVLLVTAKASEKSIQGIFDTLLGKHGEGFTDMASATIRSVVQGVLGVAIIQAILSGIGILMIGIPGSGLWALIVLFLAIMQLPPIIVLGPLSIYAFSFADTTPAVIFLIYCIIVSASDAFLKPLFLGRGVDVPMLVILLGAIGGMILSGIIGLFIGAVILALSYKVFRALLYDVPQAEKEA